MGNGNIEPSDLGIKELEQIEVEVGRINERLLKLEREKSTFKTRKDMILERLQKEFGITSPIEGEKELTRMEDEIKKLSEDHVNKFKELKERARRSGNAD